MSRVHTVVDLGLAVKLLMHLYLSRYRAAFQHSSIGTSLFVTRPIML